MAGKSRYTFTILTSAKIYKHALVVITAAGKAKPADNETTTTFVGLAEQECDTGDGTVTCTVITDLDVKLPLVTAITVGDTNRTKLYAADDNTGTAEATLGPEIGVMVEFVAANSGWVRLRQQPIVVAS